MLFSAPNDHSAKDTFSFVEELKAVSVTYKYVVSYDVTSLFTNIPLEETIHLTIDLLFEAKPDLKISRKDLQKHFQFATSQTNFLFNGSIMTKLMVLQWDRLWQLFSPIYSWDITKKGGLGITIMEDYFTIKVMLMIYLQFLKLKFMLYHFKIISIGNTAI